MVPFGFTVEAEALGAAVADPAVAEAVAFAPVSLSTYPASPEPLPSAAADALVTPSVFSALAVALVPASAAVSVLPLWLPASAPPSADPLAEVFPPLWSALLLELDPCPAELPSEPLALPEFSLLASLSPMSPATDIVAVVQDKDVSSKKMQCAPRSGRDRALPAAWHTPRLIPFGTLRVYRRRSDTKTYLVQKKAAKSTELLRSIICIYY